MLKSYYFICKGVSLAAIYATTEEAAWYELPIRHLWIGATRSNSKLVQVMEGTEWTRIYNS